MLISSVNAGNGRSRCTSAHPPSSNDTASFFDRTFQSLGEGHTHGACTCHTSHPVDPDFNHVHRRTTAARTA